LLALLEISFTVNPEMVRGLDYYTRTTFEVTSQGLGSQNAIAAGGRYNRLVKEFGGPDTPAIGFAVGMERVVGLLKQSMPLSLPVPAAFIAVLGEAAGSEGLRIAGKLRDRGLWIEVGDSESSLKSQMRRADRLAARYVFILGEEELQSGVLKWKNLADASQGDINVAEIVEFLAGIR
jgi:histidyl-tRNA synthetase